MAEPIPPKTGRRWFQFTLRRLLIFTAVLALGLGWIVNKRREVWQEDRAVAEIEKLGGHVTRSFDSLNRDGDSVNWSVLRFSLRMLLFGRTIDFPVSSVKLPCCTEPGVAEHLRHMRALRVVELPGSQIGDDEISQLIMCKDVEKLDLSATNITDAGVAQLASFPHLSRVKLDHTAVTANGLGAFAGHRLKHLSILNTTVPEKAAEQFHAAHPELKWFHHKCARSEQERNAVKRLTQAGATFPEYHDWASGLLPKDTSVVSLCDGNADLETRWQGRPQDLDLLVSIDSRLHVGLRDSVCAKAYIERLAQLDTTESLRLQFAPGRLSLLAGLNGMKRIETLSVTIDRQNATSFASLASDDLACLPKLANLLEFSLSYWSHSSPPVCLAADQTGLLPIADCPKLRQLGLYGIDIREETLSKVIQAPSLETININPTAHLSQETINKYKTELETRVAARENAAKK